MKRLTWLLLLTTLAAACGEGSTDDAPKTERELPGTLEDNGKGDWRTRYYTDVRGEVYLDDTRFDTYDALYPNYYNGYELQLEAGDVVDLRVGASSWGFDAVMGLYGPQSSSGEWGPLIAANDDTPDGYSLDSYIPFTAPATGRYLILVQEYDWNSGELWVSATCEDGPCAEEQCGEVMCTLWCEDGFQRDENGCEICACEEPPACPFVEPAPNVRCAGVVTWGKNPDSGECCQYPSPCNVPDDFEQFTSELECQGPASEGEACSMYGRQCADGLECDYQCPDGSDDPDCNLGINPGGVCVAEPACVDGETAPADDGCNTCMCDDGLWICTQIACEPAECTTDADCFETGCSGQVCAAEHRATTCEWRPEYACYNEPTTSCGCNEGQCGWSQTAELATCLGGN